MAGPLGNQVFSRPGGASALQQLQLAQQQQASVSDPVSPEEEMESPAMDPEGIDTLASSLRDMSARQMYRQTLMDMAGSKPQTGRLNLPLLQFAAQMMAPTRTGSFGEALAQATPAAIQTMQQEREFNQGRDERREAARLKLFEDLAGEERDKENKLFQAVLSKYNRAPQTLSLGDGPEGPGVYSLQPDGTLVRQGGLTPSQAAPTQMYERKGDELAAIRDNKFYDEIISSGRSAQAQNKAIEVLLPVLESTPVDGAGAPFLNNVLSWGQTFGINPAALGFDAGAAPGELARGFTARLVLDKTGGSLGVGVSNADRDFLEYQMPRFGNTDEANRALATLMKRLNDREIAVMRFADQYERQNGLVGLRQAIDAEFGGKSIFDKEGEGDFTTKNLQKLIAGKGESTVSDAVRTIDQARMKKAAEAELRFRNNEIDAITRDGLLKELGIVD